MPYLLDANVFMEAKNHHYGFDFCPAFWEWLITANAKGHVFSIEKVENEIYAGDDELTTWASDRGAGFFLKPSADLVRALGPVSAWATQQAFEPTAVNTFLQLADSYLVAHALALQYTVVTHEVASNSVKKIKVPNACIGLNVRWMTPYEMLRHERARFVLGGKS